MARFPTGDYGGVRNGPRLGSATGLRREDAPGERAHRGHLAPDQRKRLASRCCSAYFFSEITSPEVAMLPFAPVAVMLVMCPTR